MNSGLLSIIRTATVVTVLTLLVWVVAEGESLASERLETPVRIEGDPEQGLVVVPAPGAPWSGRVLVEIEGAAASVSRMREALRLGFELRPGTPGVPIEPGQHTIFLAEVLRAQPAFLGSGITLSSVEPERVEVDVERLLTRGVDVTVRLPEGVDVSSVVAEPRRVQLTYPSSAATVVDQGIEIVAEVSVEQAERIGIGLRSIIRDVQLQLPDVLTGSRFASIEPGSVSVIATLEAREDTVTLDAVPVRIQRPAFQAERWIVRVADEDQLLSGIVVTGPSDLIERIRTNDLRIFATVSLTPDDLNTQITEKTITFSDLPTPLRFEAADPTVRLTIEPAATE